MLRRWALGSWVQDSRGSREQACGLFLQQCYSNTTTLRNSVSLWRGRSSNLFHGHLMGGGGGLFRQQLLQGGVAAAGTGP